MKNNLHIVIPSVSQDKVSNGLYELSEALAELNPEKQHHGFLGGDYGYGQEFENDVFMMFPYYWGDCTCGYEEKALEWYSTHKHKESCYQAEYNKIEDTLHNDKEAKELCKKFGIAWDEGKGSAIHCTCGFNEESMKWENENEHKDDCPMIRPNFLHKPTGFSVSWYKYIGRGMNFENISKRGWEKVLKECFESIKQKGA